MLGGKKKKKKLQIERERNEKRKLETALGKMATFRSTESPLDHCPIIAIILPQNRLIVIYEPVSVLRFILYHQDRVCYEIFFQKFFCKFA